MEQRGIERDPPSGPEGAERTEKTEESATGGDEEPPEVLASAEPSPTPSASPGPVEAVLADALTRAALAGRFDVVAQLVRELEARRQARAGNVVPLDPKRRGEGQ